MSRLFFIIGVRGKSVDLIKCFMDGIFRMISTWGLTFVPSSIQISLTYAPAASGTPSLREEHLFSLPQRGSRLEGESGTPLDSMHTLRRKGDGSPSKIEGVARRAGGV